MIRPAERRVMRKKITVQSGFPLRKKLILVVCGIVLCAVLMEAGLRLFGLMFVSWQERLNRDSVNKPGGYRIMCLGESTTAGGKSSYPSQLEEILNSRNIGIKFSVINKGAVGINSASILSQLEDNLDKYKPDMVTAMIGDNDRYIKYYEDIPDTDTPLFDKFRTYRLAKIIGKNISDKSGENKSGAQTPADAEFTAASGPEYGYDKKISIAAEADPHRAPSVSASADEVRYMEQGRYYRQEGRYKEARQAFEKAIGLNPGNDKAYLGLGWCYEKEGRFSEALDSFKKVIQMNPEEEDAYLELGWLYTGQKKYAEAKEAFEMALQLTTDRKNVVYLNLGFYYKHQKDYWQAGEAFKKSIELNPANHRAYLELGWCYAYQGDNARAEESFKRAVDLRPQDDKAYGALAVLYKETGRHIDAEEYSRKATAERLKGYYAPKTVDNYREIKRILDKRGIRLVCIQYPMVCAQPLKEIFQGQDQPVFVDNDELFKRALEKSGARQYFADMFAGDFGHCTPKGNRLLAENIADTILKQVFDR